MAKKDLTELFEAQESCADTVNTSDPAEQAVEEKTAESDARIWVYLGPSIRGVVINGRIFSGTKADVVKQLENGIKEYPQIERLIIADRELTKARNDLKAKRGIYIPYEELIKKITSKEG